MAHMTPHHISYPDRVAGAYWYYADHHGGQSSDGYYLLSILSDIYTPGYLESSSRLDGGALDHYELLCARKGSLTHGGTDHGENQ